MFCTQKFTLLLPPHRTKPPSRRTPWFSSPGLPPTQSSPPLPPHRPRPPPTKPHSKRAPASSAPILHIRIAALTRRLGARGPPGAWTSLNAVLLVSRRDGGDESPAQADDSEPRRTAEGLSAPSAPLCVPNRALTPIDTRSGFPGPLFLAFLWCFVVLPDCRALAPTSVSP